MPRRPAGFDPDCGAYADPAHDAPPRYAFVLTAPTLARLIMRRAAMTPVVERSGRDHARRLAP
jgi:hypothetical protein